MGDVVVLDTARNFSSLSNDILPEWPHPRTVTLSIAQARAIDRDMCHLDAIVRRVNDVRRISQIVSMICSADRAEVERAARMISQWVRTGREPETTKPAA